MRDPLLEVFGHYSGTQLYISFGTTVDDYIPVFHPGMAIQEELPVDEIVEFYRFMQSLVLVYSCDRKILAVFKPDRFIDGRFCAAKEIFRNAARHSDIGYVVQSIAGISLQQLIAKHLKEIGSGIRAEYFNLFIIYLERFFAKPGNT